MAYSSSDNSPIPRTPIQCYLDSMVCTVLEIENQHCFWGEGEGEGEGDVSKTLENIRFH